MRCELDRFESVRNERGWHDGQQRAICRCGWKSATSNDQSVLVALWEIHQRGASHVEDLQSQLEIAEKERDREEERGDHWEGRARELGDQLEAAEARAEEWGRRVSDAWEALHVAGEIEPDRSLGEAIDSLADDRDRLAKALQGLDKAAKRVVHSMRDGSTRNIAEAIKGLRAALTNLPEPAIGESPSRAFGGEGASAVCPHGRIAYTVCNDCGGEATPEPQDKVTE